MRSLPSIDLLDAPSPWGENLGPANRLLGDYPSLYHLRILKKGLDYKYISVYGRNVD
jgi:hypothetical protein